MKIFEYCTGLFFNVKKNIPDQRYVTKSIKYSVANVNRIISTDLNLIMYKNKMFIIISLNA